MVINGLVAIRAGRRVETYKPSRGKIFKNKTDTNYGRGKQLTIRYVLKLYLFISIYIVLCIHLNKLKV